MPRWAMVIDLRKCIGCETCKHVCNEMHKSPSGSNRRKILKPIAKAELGSPRIFLPIHCMHCEKPSCLNVCPTGATKKLSDGTVVVESDKCMGCSACILACPYRARTLTHYDSFFTNTITNKDDNDLRRAKRIGTCTKCDFCRLTIDAAASKGLTPGSAPDATTLCVRYCIAEALYFGDIEDPSSEVSKLVRNNRTFRLREDLGTQPSVYYIRDDEQE